MDPNSDLKKMLKLAAKMLRDHEDEDLEGIDRDDANRLAEMVEALDGWLSKGGFLPGKWERK